MQEKETDNDSKYDWYSLANIDKSNQDTEAVRNNFDITQNTSERHAQNDEYENFATVDIEAAVKCITTNQRIKCRVL